MIIWPFFLLVFRLAFVSSPFIFFCKTNFLFLRFYSKGFRLAIAIVFFHSHLKIDLIVRASIYTYALFPRSSCCFSWANDNNNTDNAKSIQLCIQVVAERTACFFADKFRFLCVCLATRDFLTLLHSFSLAVSRCFYVVFCNYILN